MVVYVMCPIWIRQASYWELQSTRCGASDGMNESFPHQGPQKQQSCHAKLELEVRLALGRSYAPDSHVGGHGEGEQLREPACVRTVLFAKCMKCTMHNSVQFLQCVFPLTCVCPCY